MSESRRGRNTVAAKFLRRHARGRQISHDAAAALEQVKRVFKAAVLQEAAAGLPSGAVATTEDLQGALARLREGRPIGPQAPPSLPAAASSSAADEGPSSSAAAGAPSSTAHSSAPAPRALLHAAFLASGALNDADARRDGKKTGRRGVT